RRGLGTRWLGSEGDASAGLAFSPAIRTHQAVSRAARANKEGDVFDPDGHRPLSLHDTTSPRWGCPWSAPGASSSPEGFSLTPVARARPWRARAPRSGPEPA